MPIFNAGFFFFKLQDERNVIFPKPVLELCSEQVLVESFEHGTSIGTLIQDLDSIPIDSRKRFAAKGVDMFLKMVFRHNFVHCDLHPGNILGQAHHMFSRFLNLRICFMKFSLYIYFSTR